MVVWEAAEAEAVEEATAEAEVAEEATAEGAVEVETNLRRVETGEALQV